MSWMDSWSRPRKDQAVPAPYYITQAATVKYCHTCGRTIGARRSNSSKTSATEVKYCSDRCKRQKPSSAPGCLERRIQHALIELLEGRTVDPPLPPPLKSGTRAEEGVGSIGSRNSPPSPDGASIDAEQEPFRVDAAAATTTSRSSPVKARHQPKKGDPRIVLQLSEVETAVFGDRRDPEKVYGRRRNRARRGAPDAAEWTSIDMEDGFHENSLERRREAIGSHSHFYEDDDDDQDAKDERDGSGSDGDEEAGGRVAGVKLRFGMPRQQGNGDDVDDDETSDLTAKGGQRGGGDLAASEMERKRIAGQRRAEEWEMVKQAARRAVVFGLPVPAGNAPSGSRKKQTNRNKGRSSTGEGDGAAEDHETQATSMRKCEALMNGAVVEPSFAKGDWSIRWRDE